MVKIIKNKVSDITSRIRLYFFIPWHFIVFSTQNCPPNMSIIRELCDIRDGRHIACDIISKAEVCSLLDIICTK